MTQWQLNPDDALEVLTACEVYQPTPLQRVYVNDREIWAKDETGRMGVGAFKGLGGIYAVARLAQKELGVHNPADLISEASRNAAKDITFVCASAGNHGVSVATGARLLGAGCRIHLSKTVPEAFAKRLEGIGARVVWCDGSYEESIEAAIEDAEDTGAIHLADGSWTGYTEPPRLVMEGYTIMAEEMRREFEKNENWPSDVYLQAGVGGLAGAVAYMIRKNWTVQPRIIIVEPEAAPCIRESIAAQAIVTVEGPVSNMGRLDCKYPSLIAYDILRSAADTCVTVSDEAATQAATISAKMDMATTPSGAAGLAALLAEPIAPENPLVIISEGAV